MSRERDPGAMTRFKLVPVEPDIDMEMAGVDVFTQFMTECHGKSTPDSLQVRTYRAMLQASPEPSPEMVDEMCRAMWLDHHWCWGKGLSLDDDDELAHDRRDEDRARMLAFLKRIGEQP